MKFTPGQRRILLFTAGVYILTLIILPERNGRFGGLTGFAPIIRTEVVEFRETDYGAKYKFMNVEGPRPTPGPAFRKRRWRTVEHVYFPLLASEWFVIAIVSAIGLALAAEKNGT